jgi:hypothetical protein
MDANREHLALILSGVQPWNEWRRRNPGLENADLSNASLSGCLLRRVQLDGANLEGASLVDAHFIGVGLRGARLAGARVATTFADVDFNGAVDLDKVLHIGPSSIGIDTLYRSDGKVPRPFSVTRGRRTDSLPMRTRWSPIRSNSSPASSAMRAPTKPPPSDSMPTFVASGFDPGSRVEDEVESALERERETGSVVLFPAERGRPSGIGPHHSVVDPDSERRESDLAGCSLARLMTAFPPDGGARPPGAGLGSQSPPYALRS